MATTRHLRRQVRPTNSYLKPLITGLLLALAAMQSIAAPLASDDKDLTYDEMAFEIFRDLIESDTTHSTGDTLKVARHLADLLRAQGIADEDIRLVEFGGKGNLVARIRAQAPLGKPLLWLAHLDVVEADPADWSMDPKKLHEVDGFYYGRGVLDDKNEVAIAMTNFIRAHREKWPLTRDFIIALTADEEGGPHNGALHLVREHFELVEAAFVFNEGGGGIIRDGQYIANTVQAAEKTYQTFELELTNPGGHSSLPRQDNAIYELARVLVRIEDYEFPVMFNETTRAYFTGLARQATGAVQQHYEGLLQTPPAPSSVAHFRGDPAVNARLRTTCVATRLAAGHAENALPQRATATINCRVFPGVAVSEVEQQLLEVAALSDLKITPKWDSLFSDASPLDAAIMGPIRDITNDMWPGAEVLPTMSTGATDSTFFRSAGIPVYGVSGIFTYDGDNRTHGRDERMLVRSFYEGLEFMYRLTKSVTTQTDQLAPATSLRGQ